MNILYSCCYHCFPELLLPHINLNCFASHANCALWIQRQFITGFSRDLGKICRRGRGEGYSEISGGGDTLQSNCHQITTVATKHQKHFRNWAFSRYFLSEGKLGALLKSKKTLARTGKLIGKRKQGWEGEKLYEGWVKWTGIKKSWKGRGVYWARRKEGGGMKLSEYSIEMSWG